MLTLILIYILLMWVGMYLAQGMTLEWKIGYKLRQKYKIWNKKPFACMGCFAMWSILILSAIFSPLLIQMCSWDIYVIFSLIAALIGYGLIKFAERYII